MKIEELEKAEQQILGFHHCWEGYDLKSLCEAMGLTKEEYETMLSKGMLDHLPEGLREEIDALFN